MQPEEGVYLKPTKERKRKLFSLALFLCVGPLFIFIGLLYALGIIPGKEYLIYTIGFVIPIFILCVILVISLFLESLYRIELLITRNEIIQPGRGILNNFGLEKRKVFEIESGDYRRIANISVEPDEFLKVIEEKFPQYNSKVRKEG